jgi:hypothetical protein
MLKADGEKAVVDMKEYFQKLTSTIQESFQFV